MQHLIDFRELSKSALGRTCLQVGQNVLEPLLKTRALNRAYQTFLCSEGGYEAAVFFESALRQLGINYSVSDGDLSRIPKSGPVFVVSNHPFGGLDGLILGALLRRMRPDVKFLANGLLGRVKEMEEHCFFVNPFGGREAARSNIQAMRAAMRWLEEGHVLATFPAGTVSHLHLPSCQVIDPPWATNLAPLIRRYAACVVPVYFSGRNRVTFQCAGLLHARLRTLLLPRELVKRRKKPVEVRIGRAVTARQLEGFSTDRELMEYLRLRTYLQKSRCPERPKVRWIRRIAEGGNTIIGPISASLLSCEIEQLPEEAFLLESGPYVVYQASAGQIPNLLREIGRLREITFRAVGEGTGTSCDLDRFDVDYRHLFVWNRLNRELVGAYRLGLTDEILPSRGGAGMYTSTLFQFRAGTLEGLNPAIELGRSFVAADYQRKPLSLGLLWKGIGTFIATNPRYCRLFGPVSISNNYHKLSKRLMLNFLKAHKFDDELASRVKPVHPVRQLFKGALDRAFLDTVHHIDDVSSLISEIEKEASGVPVLLRHYLKLNARFLGFNVDPAFNNSVDALVLVDLRTTQTNLLQNYLGKEGAQRFLNFHGLAEDGRESA